MDNAAKTDYLKYAKGCDADTIVDGLRLLYPKFTIFKIPKGSLVNQNYISTRIRVYYDPTNNKVVDVPRIE